MKSLSFKEPWITSYVERLLGLSAATKRAIIRALERSMERKEPESGSDPARKGKSEFLSSIGGWQGDGTAEELAASIRNARTVNPDRESF